MGISLYLAMTAAEISACDSLPEKLAYMACHFSPYATGLSNIPDSLPPDSLLILNDRTPICGHDPKLISYQLCETIEMYQCSSVLLDFQRPDILETHDLCKLLIQQLPRPVGVSHVYAADLDCPVFLPPCPLDQDLEEYISPWRSHPIWLEVAADTMQITITNEGSHFSRATFLEQALPYFDASLLCHYRIDMTESGVVFSLNRTSDDLSALISKAQALEISQCIGLWQELNNEKLPVK